MKNLKKYKLINIDTINTVDNTDETIVYDITVDNDHSYNANGNIVHNCTTSANAAIHYPMASLIKECYDISLEFVKPAKIVADGGFKKFPDIIKSLAIGSHSVMLGGIINKSLESCSDCYILNDKTDEFEMVSNTDAKVLMNNKQDVYKYFRGMSTKEVQAKWGKTTLKTAEGITKYNKVEYSIDGWLENFSDYLKSNMSYSNKKTLYDYIGKANVKFITAEAYARFNK